jgi:hypothetical protein
VRKVLHPELEGSPATPFRRPAAQQLPAFCSVPVPTSGMENVPLLNIADFHPPEAGLFCQRKGRGPSPENTRADTPHHRTEPGTSRADPRSYGI